MKTIDVSVNVFAAIWANRLDDEVSENDILSRILGLKMQSIKTKDEYPTENDRGKDNQPDSTSWKDILVWSLKELGGEAKLENIYDKSREGRIRLGMEITKQHNASARECLESHCSESDKFRNKVDLFAMPKGKGKGYWALKKLSHSSMKAWNDKGVTLPHGTKLRMNYNDKIYTGEIINGLWNIGCEKFKSPSSAASGVALTTKGKNTELNGWKYWQVWRENDDYWVFIQTLRAK